MDKSITICIWHLVQVFSFSGFVICICFKCGSSCLKLYKIKDLSYLSILWVVRLFHSLHLKQVYSYFIFCKRIYSGVISGKLPVEYLEQLRPDVLEEDKDLLKKWKSF